MSKSLKDVNRKWLWAFVSMNVVVFALVITDRPPEIDWIEATWQRVTSKAGLFGALVPIATLVLSNLISSNWKARLVFWRFRNPLPGCRVFSGLAKKDPRINMERIREAAGGTLPRSPEKQNALWYQLFKKHQETPGVETAHREFLLARDLAALSLLMAIGLALLYGILPSSNQVALVYLAVMAAVYFLTSIAAQNIGCRFTLNVLAEESAAATP